jgi:hypothetical protein
MPKDSFEDRFEQHPIRETSKGIVKGGFIILIVVLVFGTIGALIWGFNVVTSDLKGQGDAQMKINSGTNRIEEYSKFFTLDKDIRTTAQNTADAKAQLDAFNKTTPVSASEPFNITETRNNLQTTYTGNHQQCVADVNAYNAASQATYTESKFKDSSLPWNYSTTVCDNPASLPAQPPAQ